MLLASSVNTRIHDSRFHLLAFEPVRPVWIAPQEVANFAMESELDFTTK